MEDQEIKHLIDKYLTTQAECNHYQDLLAESQKRLAEAEGLLFGDGTYEHCSSVLGCVQDMIVEEADLRRKKNCMYLAMAVTGWLEIAPRR